RFGRRLSGRTRRSSGHTGSHSAPDRTHTPPPSAFAAISGSEGAPARLSAPFSHPQAPAGPSLARLLAGLRSVVGAARARFRLRPPGRGSIGRLRLSVAPRFGCLGFLGHVSLPSPESGLELSPSRSWSRSTKTPTRKRCALGGSRGRNIVRPTTTSASSAKK